MGSTKFGPSAYYGHTFSGNMCTQQGKHFLGTIEIASAVIRVTWEYDEMKQYPECPRDRVLRRWQSRHLPTPQSCTAEMTHQTGSTASIWIFCVREYILDKHQVTHIAESSTRMSVSIPGHSTWDLWWTRWNRDRLFSEKFFRISLSVKFHHISQ
jgi:hypothetical protein